MTRNVELSLKAALAFSLVAWAASGLIWNAPVLGAYSEKAFAEESANVKTALELQQEIEACQAAYAAARAEADEASAAIDAGQARIDELENAIPQQQARSASAARDLYKLQQQSAGILDLLLDAGTFHDFLNGVEYFSKASDANLEEIHRLSQIKDEIVAAQTELKAARAEADARAEDARAAMLAAQEAQAEVQRRIEEEARLQAEAAAAAATLAESPRNNDSGEPVVPDGGVISVADDGAGAPAAAETADAGAGGATADSKAKKKAAAKDAAAGESAAGETEAADAATGASSDAEAETSEAAPDEPAAAEVVEEAVEEAAAPVAVPDVSPDEAAYLAEWTARIDAYLAGSPLAGQGATFARAAYAYGTDPRLSPAIACVESGKGAACFKPHNAWGWGSSSWGSWEEAIDAHVGGLARGYGGQLSEAGAKKYCPPNWKTWYSRVKSQMEMI